MGIVAENKVVNVGDRMMVLDSKDCLGLSKSDKFEAYESDFIKKNVKSGWTVIDVGAHIGWHTITLSKAVGPTGTVFAFEPDKDNHNLLIENLKMADCKNVIVNNIAVTDRTGAINFKLNRNNSGDNHISPGSSTGLQVPCTSLDDFFKLTPLVKFVKMDIQGSEYLATRGMQKILKDQDPILMTELSPRHLRRCGTRGTRYLMLLRSYGYNKFTIIRKGKSIKNISFARLVRKYVQKLGSRECNLLCFKEYNKRYNV